jgi:hypothetical protein
MDGWMNITPLAICGLWPVGSFRWFDGCLVGGVISAAVVLKSSL